jgi:HMG (high mobility group) box
MGRTGESETKTFSTKKEAEKWGADRIAQNKSDNKMSCFEGDERYDYQDFCGYASASCETLKYKISGKPRKECIRELEEKAEKELDYDSDMVILIAEIDPQELGSAVTDDLEAHAQKVGEALGKAAKRGIHSTVKKGGKKAKDESPKVEGKAFYSCSHCKSSLSAENLKRNDGACPICQWNNYETHRNLSTETLREMDNCHKAYVEAFKFEVKDTKVASDNWGRSTIPSLASKPLFVPGYEAAIQDARDAVKKWNERQSELRRYPSRASEKPKKRKSSSKDVPKIPIAKPKTGYQLFMADKKDDAMVVLKALSPDGKVKGFGPLNKKIGEMWKETTLEGKKVYNDRSVIAKAKYDREVKQWTEQNPRKAREIEQAKKEKKKEENKNWVVCMAAISAHH